MLPLCCEDTSVDLGINWDSDRNWERRLMREVIANKLQRRQELSQLKQQGQRIEAKGQLIEQMKNEINLQRQDLEGRVGF